MALFCKNSRFMAEFIVAGKVFSFYLWAKYFNFEQFQDKKGEIIFDLKI
jgi:hypothetical protein